MNPREYCFWCMHELPAPDAKCPACGKENHVRRNGGDQLPFAMLAGKYVVGHALGRGGFGITYVGLHQGLAKPVAIKEYFPGEISVRAADRIRIVPSAPEYEAQLNAGKRKALEEARTIALIQHIPHVVRIYDCFGRNNTVYIVMEYIEGETLAQRSERKGRLGWQDLWQLMAPIGEALNTLHAQGMIHRDVSPDNIMISKADGHSVLLDFGAASAKIESGQEREKVLKDGYAAPELYQTASAIDGRADQYAWAATFLYALTGKRPGNALQRQYGGDEDFWKQCRKVVPEGALDAFRRAMSVDPADRFPSMEELLSALNRPREKKSPLRGILIAAAALSGLAAVGFTVFGLLGG